MNANNLAKLVGEIPVDDLAPILEAITSTIWSHRVKHDGFVPLSIFPLCTGIGGIYPCVEILPQISDDFALKMRGAGEQGESWTNKYHIPGVCGRIVDTPEKIFGRLSQEIFGNIDNVSPSNLTPVGIIISNEITERAAICWSFIYTMKIRNLSKLVGNWKLFKTGDDESEINLLHRRTLEWMRLGANKPFFVSHQ